MQRNGLHIGRGTVEIISKNGEQQASNVTYLSKPLCCLKNEQNIVAKDVLNYKEKKIYRQCGYLKLNGSENWKAYVTNTAGKKRFCLLGTGISAYLTTQIGNLVCNTIETITAEKTYMCVDGISGGNKNELYIYLEECATMTEGQFKTWLASKNIFVKFELAQEEVETIDCFNKIQQFEGETIVYNTDNAEIEVTLSNNKAIAEINENITEIEENSTRNVITLSNTVEQAIPQTTGTTIILDNIVAIGNKLSANNNSIVVGSGVRKVLISANLNLQDLTASKSLQLALQQNNANGQAKKILKAHNYSNGTLGFLNIGNVLLDVEEGDSFSLLTYNGCAGKVRSASNGATNITVEVVE